MTGSAPTNTAAVDFEKQQAAEANAKEAARQARLTQGQQLIDQIFSGSPVMGPKQYDWSSFQAPQTMPAAMSQWLAKNPGTSTPDFSQTGSAPAGYTAVQVPGVAAGAATRSTTPLAYGRGNDPNAGFMPGASAANPSGASSGQYTGGRYTSATPTPGGVTSATSAGGGGSAWALKDASGKIYRQGDPLTYQAPTGKTTGGFDDDFYNSYRQKVLDYYNPDEQRQYDSAQRDLKYNLARAGTLQSSTAADKQGELAYNDALQKANIVSNANTQTGNLKSQIQANKQSLINQLYSTEDPTLTANLAQSSANASRLQDPTLTPAAALFTPALSAAGSVASGLLYPGQQYNSPFNTASSSPSVASASESRGKVYGV